MPVDLPMHKMVNPAFKPPAPRNPTPLQQPTYFKKELKSWESIHLNYAKTPELERKSRHWILREDYKKYLHQTICRIYRVKIKPGMFELEDGTIAPADKTPEQVIVYSLSEYVDDPKYIDSGGETGVKTISGEFYTEGRYTKHIGRFDYDERGNIINSTHMGTRNMYYIPYDPQTIRDLLAKYPHDRTLSFACAVAKESGSDPYYGNPRSVKNIDEFCDVEDIDGLISANIGNKKIPGSDAGTFLSEEYGGYQEWKLYREKLRQERMETPIDKLESKADTITKTQSTVKKSKYQYRPPEND